MDIYVGSTSDIKYNAVKNACDILGIEASISKVATNIKLGAEAQPVGFERIAQLSSHKASYVRNKYPSAISIGIENGILKCGQLVIDIAVITVSRPNERDIRITSSGIEFPYSCFKIAEKRGFYITTVGQVIAEKMGGSHDDPHSTLTGGKISREKLLTDALVIALSQL